MEAVTSTEIVVSHKQVTIEIHWKLEGIFNIIEVCFVKLCEKFARSVGKEANL